MGNRYSTAARKENAGTVRSEKSEIKKVASDVVIPNRMETTELG